MLPPDTIAPPPAWLASVILNIRHLSEGNTVDPEDAGWMLWLLHAVEAECIPPGTIAVSRDRHVHAAWKSGPKSIRVCVYQRTIVIERYDGRELKRRPDNFPTEPAAQLRDDLAWCFPRLAGGCDVDQMYDFVKVNGGTP